jgi:hypothetical protein
MPFRLPINYCLSMICSTHIACTYDNILPRILKMCHYWTNNDTLTSYSIRPKLICEHKIPRRTLIPLCDASTNESLSCPAMQFVTRLASTGNTRIIHGHILLCYTHMKLGRREYIIFSVPNCRSFWIFQGRRKYIIFSVPNCRSFWTFQDSQFLLCIYNNNYESTFVVPKMQF